MHGVLGTAGHIDHGKTSLIKALTGVECDTHKEEKRRGITINLGFTHLEIGDTSLSIVDVPGHADFIKTMVAGASGIDIFLLVIAADSGIMPQTLEHLQILKVLGVTRGVIALTKSDLVDEEILYLLREEISEITQTFPFLSNTPVVEVSSKTGEGLDTLKEAIASQAKSITRPKDPLPFRMYIDRLFTVKGAGTIVAGSVMSGTISKDDPLLALPGGRKIKIRAMQRHGKEVDSASRGDRISLNLTGVKKEELSRGMQLSTVELTQTFRFDASVTLFENSALPKTHWQGIVVVGSCELQAKMHTITIDHSSEGQTLLVQVSLDQPAVLQRGEHFVIRNSSDDRSLGGGTVIDPFPLHHKKRTEKLIGAMEAIAQGDISEILLKELRATPNPVALATIAEHINSDTDDFAKQLKPYLPSSVVLTTIGGNKVAYLKENYSQWQQEVLSVLSAYEQQHPLNKGVNTITIAALLGLDQSRASLALIKNILLEKKKQGTISQKEELWFVKQQQDAGSSTLKKQIKIVDDFIRQTREHPVALPAIISKYQRIFKLTEIKEIVKHLIEIERVVVVREVYIHRSMIQKYLPFIEETLTTHAQGLTLAEIRDTLGQGRKFTELMLSVAVSKGVVVQDHETLLYRLLKKV